MSLHFVAAKSSSQVPPSAELNPDHIASFVPDREACHRALVALGFAPAPFSLQYHRLSPQADLTPAGTGNHCVMLRHGYLEHLVPVGDTPVAAQLRMSIDRYVGVHSIVFGSGAAHADHARLQASGFATLPVIDLQRPIDTPDGPATARFTVVRVALPRRWKRGAHTVLPASHRASGMAGAMDDTPECSDRVTGGDGVRGRSRLGGRPLRKIHRAQASRRRRRTRVPATARAVGVLRCLAFSARFEFDVRQRPWIAGCEWASSDLRVTRECLAGCGLPVHELPDGRITVAGPEAIGGVFVFAET